MVKGQMATLLLLTYLGHKLKLAKSAITIFLGFGPSSIVPKHYTRLGYTFLIVRKNIFFWTKFFKKVSFFPPVEKRNDKHSYTIEINCFKKCNFITFIMIQGGNSQEFLSKIRKIFVSFRSFYEAVIHRENIINDFSSS